MRLVAFLSDPVFSPPILEGLAKSHHNLAAVVTTPDVPRGRGMKLSPTVLAQMATAMGIPVLKPQRLRDAEFLTELAALQPDACVVAAYPKLIPPAVLELPPRGCWNVHPSLLPRWRGAAPVQRAILAGDSVTGVTIMRMVERMDAGEILSQEKTPIQPGEDGEELMLRLAKLGAELLIKALDIIEAGGYKLIPQDESQVTLAPKLTEVEARLDWSQSCTTIVNRIRGVRPNLVVYSFWRGRRLQIFKAQISSATPTHPFPSPGSVISSPKILTVACGDGIIDLLSVRWEGKKMVTGAEFVRGARPEPGEKLTFYPGGTEP